MPRCCSECHPELDRGLKNGSYPIDSLSVCGPNDYVLRRRRTESCLGTTAPSLPPTTPTPRRVAQPQVVPCSSHHFSPSRGPAMRMNPSKVTGVRPAPPRPCCPVSSSSREVDHGALMSTPQRLLARWAAPGGTVGEYWSNYWAEATGS